MGVMASDIASNVRPEGIERPNYARVMREVSKILSEFAVTAPPIPLAEIVRSYGLDIKVAAFKPSKSNVAGFISFPDRRIFVNMADPPNRQRFTIAHELGHWVLHKDRFDNFPNQYHVLERLPVGSDERDPLEQEANAFAANLLVPKELILRYSLVADATELATLFAVSRDVIANRLKFLNLKAA